MGRISVRAHLVNIFLLGLCIFLRLQDPRNKVDCGDYGPSGYIYPGAVLTTNQNSSWTSHNGTFAFGFNPVSPNTYTLSIWYASIPARTVTWTANRNSLVIDGATLTFRPDGNLVLMDSLQIYPIWESNTSTLDVAYAEILDTGDFVLRNTDLEVVWETFSYPSDILMPEQRFSVGMQLVSPQTNRSAALGRYALKQDVDGQLHLFYLPSSTPYWTAISTRTGNRTFDQSYSYLNSSGFFGLFNSLDLVLASWMTTDAGIGPLRHLRLGEGGDLRVYSWSPQLLTWVVVWKAVSDECSVTNLCGQYGLCRYEPEPVCLCPPNFGFKNPDDVSQGCQAPIALNCTAGSASQKFLKLENIRYGGSNDDYVTLEGVSETECLTRCAEDCACLGIFYFYSGNGTCSLKSELQSGHVDPSGSTFVKVNGLMNLTMAGPEMASVARLRSRAVRPEIVAAIVCAFSLTCFFLVGCTYHWWRKAWRQSSAQSLWNAKDFVPGAPMRFSFKDLQAATVNFSFKLGTGSFGTVCKGLLPDGTSIAVRQLDGGRAQSQLGDKQFRTEVATIAGAHHQNLVRTYGFCSEGTTRRFLVNEHVANGSLEKFLSSDENRGPKLKLSQILVAENCNGGKVTSLDWKKRFKVILGTARAIAYLHEQCGDFIIHGNIKAESVLLDELFEPKLSDVALAKVAGVPNSKEQTKNKSAGIDAHYLPPECKLPTSSSFTAMSDVYSFGILVLEIVGGRRGCLVLEPNTSSSRRTSGTVPTHRQQNSCSESGFHKAFTQAEISEIVDKSLGTKFNSQEAERALRAAAWCTQDDPISRPSMGKVVHMLEGLTMMRTRSPAISQPFPKTSDQQASSAQGRASSATGGATPDALNSNLGDGHLEFDLNSPLISKMDL